MKGKVHRNKGKYGAPYYVEYWHKGKRLFKRFQNEADGWTFLAYLAVEEHEQTLDIREWRKNDPIGFTTFAVKYMEARKGEVKRYSDLCHQMEVACRFFGQRPVKRLKAGDIQDYLKSLPATHSNKTKANYIATLKGFFSWLKTREEIDHAPPLPTVRFDMAMRKTVDKETQAAIIEEVKRISYAVNPKIWFGIRMLATYINVRPGELRQIKEGDIDHEKGIIDLKAETTKEGKGKRIYLLPEDIDFIRSLPRAVHGLYFFRHERNRGVHKDKRFRFGRTYFYCWWQCACRNLAVEGVDLYGGTRHSSVSALAEYFSPSDIKFYGTGHVSKAFERYFQVSKEQRLTLSAATRPDGLLNHKNKVHHIGKALKQNGKLSE